MYWDPQTYSWRSLEPSAGRYSVPSKVLTYLCARRAIVAVMPADNAAARVLRLSAGGVVVSPNDEAAAVDAVTSLFFDNSRSRKLADAGRNYADAAFDIARIADRFEAILRSCRRSLFRRDRCAAKTTHVHITAARSSGRGVMLVCPATKQAVRMAHALSTSLGSSPRYPSETRSRHQAGSCSVGADGHASRRRKGGVSRRRGHPIHACSRDVVDWDGSSLDRSRKP